ncbi:hypothetical protein ABZ307_44380 [Streptomyces griseorubiginosus]|uniref:hypothetical protein n=1 Tax=Streptomyces griseorubiginosus TaxID=67304 RepID=UPI0033A55A16
MEPTVTTLVAQYGVRQLVAALGGNPALGDLAAQLFGVVLASENRLSEQLAGIERRLDEVLEQRYSTAVGSGLRTLVDAGTTTSPQVRQDELHRARAFFTEAVGSARSHLQTALAERYLLLCALALGREDAAGNALDRVNAAAFEAALAAGQVYAGNGTQERRWSSGNRRQDTRSAAEDAARIAVQLLVETGHLGVSLGRAAPSQVDGPSVSRSLGFTTWSIRPSPDASMLHFGPLRIEWNRVTRSPSQSLRYARILRPNDAPSPAPPDVLYVHGEVQVHPVLALPLTLQLASPPEWPSQLGRAGGSWTMEAGQGGFVFFCESAPMIPFSRNDWDKARLIVGRVFIFEAPPATRPAVPH